MERQAAHEVLETQEALLLLRRAMGGVLPQISLNEQRDVTHIIETLGRTE